MKRYVTALSIAGSDPSGGAGIQADIKTMSALGVYAMTAITAVTVQNTIGVRSVTGIDPATVRGQIDAVFDDIRPDAVKIGMLFTAENVEATALALSHHKAVNIVLDPVMVATSGHKLISDRAINLIIERLIPIATLITPNANEAIELTGASDTGLQIERLRALGARNILLKGGDKTQESTLASDYLSLEGSTHITRLASPRSTTANTHGTGCTLSSATASFLAKGMSLSDSVTAAKRYITEAITAGAEVAIGHGHGPVNHFHSPHPLETII